MKKSAIFGLLAGAVCSLLPVAGNGQAAAVEDNCKGYFPKPYIITNKPFKALLTGDEVAEFRTSLFSGITYRLAAGSVGDNYVIYAVYDNQHNLIFSNAEYENAPYWDFVVDGYMDCIVEARLDAQKTTSGMVVMMTGFKLDKFN